MGWGLRMPEYSSFIRSVRIRYLSGLTVLALSVIGLIAALNHINTYRNRVDMLSALIASFGTSLDNAANFAENAASAWHVTAKEEFTGPACTPASWCGASRKSPTIWRNSRPG
jgi:hypothetical protein